MKRLFVALVLALTTSLVFGQSRCVSSDWLKTPMPGLDIGTRVYTASVEEGRVQYYYCTTRYAVETFYIVTKASYTPPSVLDVSSTLAQASTPAAAFDALWTSYVTASDSDPDIQFLKRVAKVEARWNPERPSDPAYSVRTNGSFTTRPAFNIVNTNGVLTVGSRNGTATVRSPCACNRLVIELNGNPYCGFDNTERVTICSRN